MSEGRWTVGWTFVAAAPQDVVFARSDPDRTLHLANRQFGELQDWLELFDAVKRDEHDPRPLIPYQDIRDERLQYVTADLVTGTLRKLLEQDIAAVVGQTQTYDGSLPQTFQHFLEVASQTGMYCT